MGENEMNERTKKKISETMKAKNNVGWHHSEETKKKISEAMMGKYLGKNNPMFGKHHSDETKQKISKAVKNVSEFVAKAKPIICVETNEKFDSVGKAAKICNMNRGNIRQCCNGKRKTAYGYHWRYADE